jgi:hypothetical protein
MGQKWARYTPLYWALYGLGVASHAAQPVTNTFGWMGDLAMVVPGVDEADEADEVLQGVGEAAYDASSDVSYSTEPVTTSGRIEGGPDPLQNYGTATRNPSEFVLLTDADADFHGWIAAVQEDMEVEAVREAARAAADAVAYDAETREIVDEVLNAQNQAEFDAAMDLIEDDEDRFMPVYNARLLQRTPEEQSPVYRFLFARIMRRRPRPRLRRRRFLR